MDNRGIHSPETEKESPTMKETVRSLKLYFILSGIIGIWGSIGQFVLASANPLFAVFGILSLIFAIAYFCMGVSLPKLILASPNVIFNLLYANAAYSVIVFLIGLTGGFQPMAAGFLAFGLLIVWYLFVNVKRLSQEERVRIQQDIPQ